MKRARSSTKSTTSKYKKTKSSDSLAMYKQPKNPVRFVKRHTDYFTVIVNGVTGVLGAFNFTLASVPNYTEFTNLYDQYKISAISVCFYPRQTEVTTLLPADSAKANARFLSAIDYNDDTAPASFDAIREYESCKVTSCVEKHEVYIKEPLFLNNSGQNVNGWVSTANPSTRFYGLKYGCEPTLVSGANPFTYQVECVFYMAFKNVK